MFSILRRVPQDVWYLLAFLAVIVFTAVNVVAMDAEKKASREQSSVTAPTTPSPSPSSAPSATASPS